MNVDEAGSNDLALGRNNLSGATGRYAFRNLHDLSALNGNVQRSVQFLRRVDDRSALNQQIEVRAAILQRGCCGGKAVAGGEEGDRSKGGLAEPPPTYFRVYRFLVLHQFRILPLELCETIR